MHQGQHRLSFAEIDEVNKMYLCQYNSEALSVLTYTKEDFPAFSALTCVRATPVRSRVVCVHVLDCYIEVLHSLIIPYSKPAFRPMSVLSFCLY